MHVSVCPGLSSAELSSSRRCRCPTCVLEDPFHRAISPPPPESAQGHFLLTQELMPSLRASAPSRVVCVSSVGNWLLGPEEGILFDDINADKKYDEWERYGQSKLANILHAYEIQRRYGSEGITAVSLHPGNIGGTNLSRHFSISWIFRMLTNGRTWTVIATDSNKSLPQGAATSVFAAIAPLEGTAAATGAVSALKPGAHYADCKETARVHPLALDPALASRLWEVSEQMVQQALAK